MAVHDMRQHFWNVWSRQYLAFLRERHTTDQLHFKSATTKQSPKVGEIVLLSEQNIKRKHWHLAKISALPISTDGQIRVAQLQLASGRSISRPIQDVYLLEIVPTKLENPHTNQSQEQQMSKLLRRQHEKMMRFPST